MKVRELALAFGPFLVGSALFAGVYALYTGGLR